MERQGWMRAAASAALLAAIAMSAAGCLVKERETTITLEPGGSGTWVVVDRDVHSDASAAAERLREEGDYLAEVGAGRHDAALALGAIGCSEVSTRIVRGEWPYMVVTQSRFADLAAAFQGLLDRAGVPGRSSLETKGDRVTWRLEADTREEAQLERTEEGPDVLGALLGGKPPRWLLGRGRFVKAVGFQLSQDGRVAVLEDFEGKDLEKTGGILSLSLTWTVKDGR